MSALRTDTQWRERGQGKEAKVGTASSAVHMGKDTLAERSKAVAQGAIPKGRGFEPHRCHFSLLPPAPFDAARRAPHRADPLTHHPSMPCSLLNQHSKAIYNSYSVVV